MDQWCQGEIEAVRHVTGKKAEEWQAQAEAWWVKGWRESIQVEISGAS